MIEKICNICNRPYFVEKRRAEKSKFCSLKCWGKYIHISGIYKGSRSPRWKRIPMICKGCGNVFYIRSSLSKGYRKRKYCSVECVKKKTPWNKGLTKENDERVKRNAENTSLYFRTHSLEEIYGKEKANEIRERLRNFALLNTERNLRNNPMKRIEVRNKVSLKLKGRFSGNKNNMYGRITYPKARYIEELGHSVRSEWEKIIALRLKEADIPYKWEGITLKCNGGNNTYTPDFVVGNILIEVKGPLFDKQRKKMKEIIQNYPFIFAIVTSKKSLRRYDFTFCKNIFLLEELDKLISWLNETRKNC